MGEAQKIGEVRADVYAVFVGCGACGGVVGMVEEDGEEGLCATGVLDYLRGEELVFGCGVVVGTGGGLKGGVCGG